MSIGISAAIVGTSLFLYLSQMYDDNHFFIKGDIVNFDDSSKYISDLLAYLIHDDVHNIYKLKIASEKKAKSDFRSGKVQMYLIVPDGFEESVMTGRNDKKIQYVIYSSHKGIWSIMIELFNDEIENFFVGAQKASVSAWKMMEKEAVSADKSLVMKQIDEDFLEFLIDRNDKYDDVILGFGDGESFWEFYFVSIFIFLVLFSGLQTGRLFWNNKKDVKQLLYSKGMGVVEQVISEYLAYCILIFLYSLIILFVFKIIIAVFGVSSLAKIGFSFIIYSFPVALVIAAMHFFIYEITSEVSSSLVMMFTMTVMMCYLSGYFYESSFFPEPIQTVGRLLPTGAMLSYCESLMKQKFDGLSLLYCVLWIVLFLIVSLIARRKKIFY